MKKNILVATIAAISSVASVGVMADARTDSMGGASVASSDYLAAAGSNPALTTQYRDNDDFGLLVPSLTVEGSDPSKITDVDFDDYDEWLNNLSYELGSMPQYAPAVDNAKENLTSLLQEMDGTATLDLSAIVALSIPNQYLSATVFAGGKAHLITGFDLNEDDITLIENATSQADLDGLQSSANIVGAAITEVGIALGKTFAIGDRDWSFGVSPKMQKVETYNYQASYANYDEDDFDAARYSNEDTNFNMDLGVSTKFGENWTFGLAVKDAISKDYDTVTIDGVQHTYKVSPQATAGIAYNTRLFTAAFDLDLNEREHFAMGDERQFARLGAEFNAWDWAQLRVGYRHSMTGNLQDAITAGIGLSPFDLINIDLGAFYADENEAGATMNLSLTF